MDAYRSADIVNAKSWGAIPYFGRWDEERAIREAHKHFIVDEARMALTNNGVFSHCLPLRRNVKATDAVMDSPNCVAIEEAENRLHVQKAVMAALVAQPGSRGLGAGDSNSNCTNTDDPTTGTTHVLRFHQLPAPASSPQSQDIVLAFSGGLDTSFCIPWLLERDYRVHTVFADTGGVNADERVFIEGRAIELGAALHVAVDAGPALWEEFVVRFVMAGEGCHGQYPLLVSDRYLIVNAALKRCDELGTKLIAHCCTGMGNDQVRFDLSVKVLGDYTIVAPIREIQREHTEMRTYEQQYLQQRGFSVRAKQKAYTINENLLGLTMSGGEIDRWQVPREGARGWCTPRAEWPLVPLQIRVGFEQGVAVSPDGKRIAGHELLAKLNDAFARYGVGRGMYTGDTTIGLKDRIVYEAPAWLRCLQRIARWRKRSSASRRIAASRSSRSSGSSSFTKASSTIRSRPMSKRSCGRASVASTAR